MADSADQVRNVTAFMKVSDNHDDKDEDNILTEVVYKNIKETFQHNLPIQDIKALPSTRKTYVKEVVVTTTLVHVHDSLIFKFDIKMLIIQNCTVYI